MTPGSATPRFAVVGTGAISQVMHVPILAEREDVDLAVLSDTDLAKARTIAGRVGVAEALTPDDVLRREDIDAVVLCTPNGEHEAMAVAALEAGKDVFVERPLAITAEGAARVVGAARASGRVLVVGQPQRFRADVSAVHAFVAGGEMGDVYAVRGSWLTRRIPVMRPTWRQRMDESGGGALMELGVPAIDLCLWMVGYPAVRRVACVTTHGDFEVEDAASIMVEAEGGVAISVEVSSRLFAGTDRYYARVMGTEGSASLPPLEIYKQLGGRPLDVTPRQPRPRGGENAYTNAYRRQLDHFVRAVAGTADVALPTDQVALMGLIEMAYRSAREGREVSP